MATVTITLRDSGPPDTIDLDDLTPTARALAEALAQGTGRDIWMESDAPIRDRVAGWESWYTAEEAAEPERRPWRGWAHYPADSPVEPIQYLEAEAAKIPPGWHVLGHPSQHVPSAAASADDDYVDRRHVLTYLSSHGTPVSPAGWDTLRGTGHWPEPDRYVDGRPQWRSTTLDAYIARPYERWTASQVAAYLGYGGSPQTAAGSARRQLSRWGILPVDRTPGRGGEQRYAADQVQAAHANRPRPGRAAARHPERITMPETLPSMPETVPVITETSHSHHHGPEHHGIDPATQWWCLSVRRPGRGDAQASVMPPGAAAHRHPAVPISLHEPLLTVTLPADDQDDTEGAAHYAISVARQMVAYLSGEAGAWEELERLLGPDGPMGGTSSAALARLGEWRDLRRAGSPAELNI